MTYSIFTIIADGLYQAVGDSLIFPFVIIAVFLFLLLGLKAPKIVVFMILVPVSIGVGFVTASKYMSGWTTAMEVLPIVLMIVGGLLFAGILAKLTNA